MYYYIRRMEESINTDIGTIIGVSAPVRILKKRIIKVSRVDFSLLITGESGSGKELVARAVHACSERSGHPFVPVNAASIPVNLLESEMFGYAKGAFTDARQDRKGMIEEADGGTLFLDEIGELPTELQSKLLRVIQEGELKRVGENRYRKINVRLISATNRDLKKMIMEGNFRQDLFYRIQDLIINVPPLKERHEDIPLLIDHFVNKYGFNFTKEDMEKLILHCYGREWEGNIRELESFLKRAHTYYPDNYFFDSESREFPGGLIAMREKFEEMLIKRALIKNGGNKRKCAEDLGISRGYLFTLIKKYEITNESRNNLPV